MKNIILVIFLVVFSGFLSAVEAKVVPLPDLINPDSIQVDSHQLYITEKESIYIYSLKDFRLIKKFGKSGEGPQEFRINIFSEGKIYIHLEPEVLLVNSLKKISYFTKKGDYIKEIRTTTGLQFKPIGNGFVSYGSLLEKKIMYRTINLHSSDLKKIKELYRTQVGGMGKDINPVILLKPPLFYVSSGRVFVGGNDDGIKVFADNGNHLYSINGEYEPIPFSKEQQRKFEMDFKLHPRFGSLYEVVKAQLKYPENYPLVKYFHVADQKVYVLTYKKVNGESEFFIFTSEGKLLKRIMLPVKEKDAMGAYPYAIQGGKLYQVLDNEETEEWELHIADTTSAR